MNENDGRVRVCVIPDRDIRAWCDGREPVSIDLLMTVDPSVIIAGMMNMHTASILGQMSGYKPLQAPHTASTEAKCSGLG